MIIFLIILGWYVSGLCLIYVCEILENQQLVNILDWNAKSVTLCILGGFLGLVLLIPLVAMVGEYISNHIKNKTLREVLKIRKKK